MIKLITKQKFYNFENMLHSFELHNSDYSLMETMHEFIDDYDDDEITVYGYFDMNDELIGLIRFSEEDLDYLFDEKEYNLNDKITLIGALFVLPSYRGIGMGRELVNFAISKSTTDVLVADPINVEASQFFSSIGFSQKNDFDDTEGWYLYKRKSEHINHKV